MSIPFFINDDPQLFLDGRFLAESTRTRIVPQRPTKTNEHCLTRCATAYVTLLEPDGRFHGFDALTKDGSEWREVSRGTAPEEEDLLGLIFGAETVFLDPTSLEEARYKRFEGDRNRISASLEGRDRYGCQITTRIAYRGTLE